MASITQAEIESLVKKAVEDMGNVNFADLLSDYQKMRLENRDLTAGLLDCDRNGDLPVPIIVEVQT